MKKANKHTVAISVTALVIDILMKYLALTQPFFQKGCLVSQSFCLSLFKNQGVAFSIPIPSYISVAITMIVIGLLTFYAYKFRNKTLNITSGSILIIVGATSNMIDRIINGFVTDYLIFFNTSAINIADILIASGFLILLWYSFSKGKLDNN